MQLEPPTVLALLLCSGVHRDSATGKQYILGNLTNTTPGLRHGPADEIWVYAEVSARRGPLALRIVLVRVDPLSGATEQWGWADFEAWAPHAGSVAVLTSPLGRLADFAHGSYRARILWQERMLLERSLEIERPERNGR